MKRWRRSFPAVSVVLLGGLAGAADAPQRPCAGPLEAEALDYDRNIQDRHLREHQIVMLTPGGERTHENDSAIYTGYDVAANAFRYPGHRRSRGLPSRDRRGEGPCSGCRASGHKGIVARLVEADGKPVPKPPSKDS